MLVNGSKAFEYWKNQPAKIVRKYYFFDLENSIQVQTGKEKPRFKERGPYSYIEKIEKRNIQFLGIELLRFSPVISLYFDRSLSVGDESDLITVLNIPSLVCR